MSKRVNEKIVKAETHVVDVTVRYVVVTPAGSSREDAELMVERLLLTNLEPLSPAYNEVGDIAVLHSVQVTEPDEQPQLKKPKPETTQEVPEGDEVPDSDEAEPEQSPVETRRDDSDDEEEHRGAKEFLLSRRPRKDAWEQREVEILEEFYSQGVDRVERELAYHGFHRTPQAIAGYASRAGIAPQRASVTPAGRAAMSVLSDVGEATTTELHALVDGNFSYYQVHYGLRRAEVRGLVKGEVVEGFEKNMAPIRWRLTAKGRSMSYANGGRGGKAEAASVGA